MKDQCAQRLNLLTTCISANDVTCLSQETHERSVHKLFFAIYWIHLTPQTCHIFVLWIIYTLASLFIHAALYTTIFGQCLLEEMRLLFYLMRLWLPNTAHLFPHNWKDVLTLIPYAIEHLTVK